MIRFGWINSLFGGLLISLCCPCCVVPLFLNLFGIGCAGLNSFLLPYRPIFVSLTIISLTYSYFRYRPSKFQFFMMVLLTLSLSFSPEILHLYHNQVSADAKFDGEMIVTHWQIVGMHCQSCCSTVKHALEKLTGVLSVNVDLDSGQADLITQIPMEDDAVIQAVLAVGFQAYKII